MQRSISQKENEKLHLLQQINELQSRIQQQQSQVGMETVRYKEIEKVLQEERRNMHAMENQLRDAARKEESLQIEVERYRLRVESKCPCLTRLGLQKHIDN